MQSGIEQKKRLYLMEGRAMTVTLSEAAEAKHVSRNALWKAIRRGELTARKSSGGVWLVEEDDRWRDYRPRNYTGKRGEPASATEEE